MRPSRLRLLVMHVSRRCDQTCAHCSIWRGGGAMAEELGLSQRLDIIREASRLGARAVLFTGGEPLLCDHIESLARSAKALGLNVQIATNGLGLSRAAAWMAGSVDEIYVSLDGPEEIHDQVRGRRMFSRLAQGMKDVLSLSPRPRVIGRSVIAAGSAGAIEATVSAARSLGLDALSFLGVDTKSEAFGGEPESRRRLRPGPREVDALLAAIERLARAGALGSFVLEDERKLASMAREFLESGHRVTPRCNAPEWSSVVEADGAIRPCFFQPVVRSESAQGIGALRGSASYKGALRSLGEGNPICAACVCPKHVPRGFPGLTARLASVLGRIRPRTAEGARSPA